MKNSTRTGRCVDPRRLVMLVLVSGADFRTAPERGTIFGWEASDCKIERVQSGRSRKHDLPVLVVKLLEPLVSHGLSQGMSAHEALPRYLAT